MPKKRIALDADGVLLNYNDAYPYVYERAFGRPLPLLRADAYHATNAYGLTLVKGSPEYDRFFASFDENAWATMPVFEGVIEGCHALHDAGYELICVSSMPPEFADARLRNFQLHDLPIAQVIATGRHSGDNPKLTVIEELQPVGFVDDLASNFLGVGSSVHKALVDRKCFDSPNTPEDTRLANTHHPSLKHFCDWWLTNKH